MYKSVSILSLLVVVLGLSVGAIWVQGALSLSTVAAADPTTVPTAVIESGQDLSIGYHNDSSPDQPVLLRQAAFTAFGSDTQQAFGNLQHRRVGAREVLRLAPNFKTQPDARLEIVLTQSATPTRKEIGSATSLGELKSADGPEEYDVPAGQDFSAVALYARGQDAVFAIACLEPKPACDVVPSRSRLSLLEPSSAPTTCLGINTIQQLNLTGTPPEALDIDAYRLEVKGLVDNPLSLSYADLQKLPATSNVSLLICSGFFADVAEWTGVPLSVLMEQAKVKPEWKAVRFESVDGYWSALDRGDFKPEDVIVAYEVNGQPLPEKHGYPVRVAIKGDYGSRWVKWLGSVQILEK